MASKKNQQSKVTNLSSKRSKKSSKAIQPSIDASDSIPSSFPEQEELPTMETPKNAQLEEKGKQIADRRTRIKRLQEQEKGLTAEALTIMHQHEIRRYDRNGVVLLIKETEKLDVEVS